MATAAGTTRVLRCHHGLAVHLDNQGMSTLAIANAVVNGGRTPDGGASIYIYLYI